MSLWRRVLAELAVVVVVTTVTVAAVQWLPFVEMMENWLSDYRIATLTAPQPQSPDIVIVTITEDTVQQFPYRSPLDRRFVASILTLLDKAGARAIGVDLLFDQATEEDKDEELRQVIQNLATPLIIGVIGEPEGLNEDQEAYLADFVPFDHRAYVTLFKDGIDSTVRRMYPGRTDSAGHFIAGFPLAIAEKIEPGRHFEALPITWRAGPGNGSPPFRKFPAHTLKMIPNEWFKGKIVLIGADLTLTDRHRTPMASIKSGYQLMAGVEIHAHALDQLLSGRRPPVLSLPAKFALAVTLSLMGVMLARVGGGLVATIVLASVLIVAIWAAGFILYRTEGIMVPLVLPTAALGGAWWASEIQNSWRERRQKRFLKDAFARYMSPELVNELIEHPDKLVLGGERREMSFLFTDVAGFTSLSETVEPSLLGRMLNNYFNGLCGIIIAEGGTVIDFVGDAIFAIFGAPLAQPDHAVRAIACAAKIQAFASQFRQTDEPQQWKWGDTRIGVHSGSALVGNFGSDLKFKYAPVGDAVNTASRIEGLNKFFGTTICFSEALIAAAGFGDVRPLGRCVMKGKTEPLGVFEPMSEVWRTSAPGQTYMEAYRLMAQGHATEALELFEQLEADQPEDGCIAFHAARLRAGETSDVVILEEK